MANRRSIFLINKKFQLRFAFYVCSWLIALSFVYPLVISNLFDYFMKYMMSDPNGPGVAVLDQTRKDFLTLLILLQMILLSLTFMISIFMSHRIAGPLYKLSRFFNEAKAGNLGQKLSFRKNDYFHEIATAYNEMMTAINANAQRTQSGIEASIAKIKKALPEVSPGVRTDLESALTALQEAQKHDQ